MLPILLNCLPLFPDALIHRFITVVELVGQALGGLVDVEFVSLRIQTLRQDVVNSRKKCGVLSLFSFVNCIAVFGVRELAAAPSAEFVHVRRNLRSLRPLNLSSAQRNEILLVKRFESVSLEPVLAAVAAGLIYDFISMLIVRINW